ncbi:MAG: AraC family transcriptional regulator ligand-binding domain-containing protein [Panacagrimonas sp.]
MKTAASRMSFGKQLQTPAIPMAYLQLMVEIMAEHGVGLDALLSGTTIEPAQATRPDARMAAVQWGQIVLNALRLSGCRALGYEYGLRMQLSVHGFLGFATMTSLSGEEALKVLQRYFQSRQRNMQVSWGVEGESCVIGLRELHPLGPVRGFMIEALLLGIMRGVSASVSSHDTTDFELGFDWAEPSYHAAYRERLPRTRFGQPGNIVRFPARLLRVRPLLADALASQQAIERCEHELSLAGGADADLAARVRGALTGAAVPYPSQQDMATRLHLSGRSLARKLSAEGTSFTQLLDEARRRDALVLLEHSALKLEQIATRLGYLNPANFTRAFRAWTGEAPSRYRRRFARGPAEAKP